MTELPAGSSAGVLLALGKGYTAKEDGSIIGPTGKVLKESVTSSGYKFFGIKQSGKSVNVPSHRFVCAFFLGPDVLDFECIRHIDNDKLNNNWENLIPGSLSENFQDNDIEWRRDFAKRGAHMNRRLTDEQVRDIKVLVKYFPTQQVAKKFNVAPTTIVQIRDGKSYEWL